MPASMRVFLSYRRSDHVHTQPSALRGALERVLDQRIGAGKARIFYDREAIRPGVAFNRLILDFVHAADVMLVLVGRNWRPALAQAERDWVEWEVRQASRARTVVIPVVFDDAPFPPPSELRGALGKLSTINAFHFDTRYFDRSAAELADLCIERRPRRWWTPTVTRIALAILRFGVLLPAAAIVAVLAVSMVDQAEVPIEQAEPPIEEVEPPPRIEAPAVPAPAPKPRPEPRRRREPSPVRPQPRATDFRPCDGLQARIASQRSRIVEVVLHNASGVALRIPASEDADVWVDDAIVESNGAPSDRRLGPGEVFSMEVRPAVPVAGRRVRVRVQGIRPADGPEAPACTLEVRSPR